jgi:N12 class adenine-specific DNA methylase
MNAHVLRRDDGSYLTFAGLAEDLQLWPWQRDFVDRALSVPAAMAAHEMGLGKTRTAIAVCMTLRQFGIANRPLYIVPNHLIEQAHREALQAAPAGKILKVTREDLNRHGRRMFAARCATGDWDMVIMTHETFSSIPVPAARRTAMARRSTYRPGVLQPSPRCGRQAHRGGGAIAARTH